MNTISRHIPPLAPVTGRKQDGISPSSKIRWAIFIAITLVALAIRLPQLAERPMHTDESVNAYITGELLEGQAFHYDSQDRHGPGLYVIAEPIVRLFGAKSLSELTETQLRFSTVITGAATVLLFGAGVEMFGFISCLVAALLFAFSPLPVYYNRYFIHETLFVLATLGFIITGGRVLRTKALATGALAGGFAALMLACKETAVIHFFAITMALIASRLRSTKNSPTSGSREISLLKVFSIAAGTFIITIVLLFTWFGRNWNVFSEMFHAIGRFSARAGGEGHEKPFLYYVQILRDTPGLVLLAIGGAFVAGWKFFFRADLANGFWLFCAAATFLIYSFIPYKTPWLALSILLPMSMLVGILIQSTWATFRFRGRAVVLICGAILFAAQLQHTTKWCYKLSSDEANPYAYAHTSEDLLRLPGHLERLIINDHIAKPRIAVVASDPWPLPWYLRKFSEVGYWQPGQKIGDANIFITSMDVADDLAEKLKSFRPEYFGARPGVLLILWTPENLSQPHE